MMHQYAWIIKLVSFLALFLFMHSSPLMAQMTAEYSSGVHPNNLVYLVIKALTQTCHRRLILLF